MIKARNCNGKYRRIQEGINTTVKIAQAMGQCFLRDKAASFNPLSAALNKTVALPKVSLSFTGELALLIAPDSAKAIFLLTNLVIPIIIILWTSRDCVIVLGLTDMKSACMLNGKDIKRL